MATQSPVRSKIPGLSVSKSDPILSPTRGTRIKSRLVGNPYDVDETGVHGGEYSVRPQMKESVVFLRKLVNYQQESGGIAGSSGYRGLISPLDGPVQPRTPRALRPQTSSSQMKQGAYVLKRAEVSNIRNLEAVRAVCDHNAEVSEKVGQHGKAETWKLLSRIVVGRMHMSGSVQWRPKSSLAMGSNLVKLILKYYETMGDVQMLATIVCVLRQENSDKPESSLLPNEIKYDGYLRRYSDLLYSWGLLSLRAQLNKRLRYTYESREVFGVPSNGSQIAEAISLFSECPHCHQPTTTNYCNNCSDYAFRCTICDTAVRGLFTGKQSP